LVDEAAVDEALRVLHRYSLIDHDRSARDREVRVHQLIQRATRENLGGGPGTVPEALASAAAAALEAVWPEAERDELGQVLRANAAALQHAAGPALWTGGRYDVLFYSATSLGRTGQATAAREAYAAIRDSAQRHLGPDHPDTMRARGHTAQWQGAVGDAAGAAAAYREVLADQVRVLGVDHPDTMLTRHNLADLRGRAGDAAGAAGMLEELLADRLRMFHPDDSDTLTVRSNVARWRGEAGDAPGAAAAYQELLADMARLLGPDHLDTMIARANLAVPRR
jgi:hypothetical protein